jgi:transcriptional regulator with XRE-family HTH domain
MTPSAFRAWRRNQGLTQAKCAEALGVTLLTIKRWEKGERPWKPDSAGNPTRLEIPRTVALACAAIAAGLDADCPLPRQPVEPQKSTVRRRKRI